MLDTRISEIIRFKNLQISTKIPKLENCTLKKTSIWTKNNNGFLNLHPQKNTISNMLRITDFIEKY